VVAGAGPAWSDAERSSGAAERSGGDGRRRAF
jgi:hypothetical protein